MKKLFELPDNVKLYYLLLIGYPNENAESCRTGHNVFRDMDEIAAEL